MLPFSVGDSAESFKLELPVGRPLLRAGFGLVTFLGLLGPKKQISRIFYCIHLNH